MKNISHVLGKNSLCPSKGQKTYWENIISTPKTVRVELEKYFDSTKNEI